MEDIVIDLTPTAEQKQSRERAEAALKEFFESRHPGPFHGTAWMGDGYIEASVFNNRIHLSAVFVLPDKRGTRLGSDYLRQFLALADKHAVEVECSVKPFGVQDPRTKKGVRELQQWYKRYGFQPVKNRINYLLRPAAEAK